MKNLLYIICLIATSAFLAGCSKENVDVPASSHNASLVLVTGVRNTTPVLTALDGASGRELWTVPFEGQVEAGNKKLFLNDWWQSVHRLNSYQDTVALYARRDTLTNLLQIGILNGDVQLRTNTQFRPNYMVKCCSDIQTNKLLHINNGAAVMLLTQKNWLETMQSVLYVKDVQSDAFLWSKQVPVDARFEIVGQRILVFAKDYGYALDKATGTKLTDYPYAGLSVADTNLLCSIDGHVAQLVDIATTSIRWRLNAPETLRIRGVHQNVIIFEGSPDLLNGHPHNYYGVDMQTGLQQWQIQASPIPYYSNSFVHNGVLLLGGLDGTLYAIQAETSLPLWSQRIGDGLNGGYASRIVARNEKVFFLNGDKVLAFSLKDGKQLWKYQGYVVSSLHAFDQTELEL